MTKWSLFVLVYVPTTLSGLNGWYRLTSDAHSTKDFGSWFKFDRNIPILLVGSLQSLHMPRHQLCFRDMQNRSCKYTGMELLRNEFLHYIETMLVRLNPSCLMQSSVGSTPDVVVVALFITLRPRQNGRHFADDILKCIFLNEIVWIPIEISLKFVPKGPVDNIPALV